MGIQFKQVDGLEDTFDNLSGDLQEQITGTSISGMASGTFDFSGVKTFISNVSCSGEAGLGVTRDNLYVYGNSFVTSGLLVGKDINTIRSTSAPPEGTFQVTGGASYFEGDVNVRNDGNIVVGADIVVSGDIAVGGDIVAGQIYGTGLNITGTGTFTGLDADTATIRRIDSDYVTSTSSSFTHFYSTNASVDNEIDAYAFSGSPLGTAVFGSGEFNSIRLTGDATRGFTGILKLDNIPDETQTGFLPLPADGTVFRSGNYLMII